jgi:tRNA threonylcarbamoyladenosine biosynthesis protein TsaE
MSSPTGVSQAPGLPSLTLSLDSAENTLAFGERVGHVLTGGDVLALTGDLGVGKTLITRGIALGLGIPVEQVNSPTFTLIQAYVYDGCVPVIHVDLYRLEHPSAIAQLGLEDYLTPQNIVIIEWADRFLQALPPDYLVIHIEHGKTETLRHLTAKGTGPRSSHIVTTLLRDLRDNHAAPQPSSNR